MLALYVPYNIFSSPLCVITSSLSLCLLWATLCGFCCLFFPSLHLCLLVYACVFVLICVIKHSSYLWFCVGLHPSLNMRSQVPFRNFAWWHMCLCTPILWLYGHQIQTYICPSRTPSLVCLFDNMFVCSFVFFLSLSTCLACLPSALFVSLLSLLHVCCLCVFFVCCMNMLGARAQLPKCKQNQQAQ